MIKQKKLWALGLACSMMLGTCMTSYANFHWEVEDGKALGSATITLIDFDGIPYQQEAVIISDGAVVTFTELDYFADYGETVYDYNGNCIGGALGLAVDAGLGVDPGVSFQYPIHSNMWVEKEYNTSGIDEAGVFEIGTQEYAANGAYLDTRWRQCFVINGKFNPALMSNVQWFDTADTAADPNTAPDTTTDTTTDTSADTTKSSHRSSDMVYFWKCDSVGWWLEAIDGSYMVNSWYLSPASGLWYYMGPNGYMLTDTITPDGYYVNADGVWVF